MLGDILAWLADHPGTFETAASRHLALSVTALAAAMALALPLALVLVRWHRAAGPAIAAVNVLRTIPSLALLAAILPLLGTGFLPSVIALTLYGLPAILINTHTALREVDPDVRALVHLANVDRELHFSANWGRIEKPLRPYKAVLEGKAP